MDSVNFTGYVMSNRIMIMNDYSQRMPKQLLWLILTFHHNFQLD